MDLMKSASSEDLPTIYIGNPGFPPKSEDFTNLMMN